MEDSIEKTPEPTRASPAAAAPRGSIPINHYLSAAKDAELKLLLRKKATATGRVARALKEEAEADQAILDYVATTYPAPAGAESA